MYFITQNLPEEKVLFASNSETEAYNYFNLKIQHGEGWFELWEEGTDIPLQADGESFYAPYEPSKWESMRDGRARGVLGRKKIHHFPSNERYCLILTTWEW